MAVLVCVATLCQLHSVVLAAVQTSDVEKAEYLWHGMRFERERIRSGAFTLHGVRVVHDDKKPQTFRIEAESTFDFPANLLRYDRSESWYSDDDERPSYVASNKYVRTGDESLHATDPVTVVTRARSNVRPIGELKPIDVRCMGIAEPAEFGVSLEEMLATLQAGLQLEEIEEVQPIESDLVNGNKHGGKCWKFRGFATHVLPLSI